MQVALTSAGVRADLAREMKPSDHAHRILELLERHGAAGSSRKPADKGQVSSAVKALRHTDDVRRAADGERPRRRRRAR